MMFTYLTIFIVISPTILCWQVSFSRDENSEHMGCYDATASNLFTITPGDYIPTDLSPVACMTACGKRWQIAGIQNGSLCLCSKTAPINFVTDSLCDVDCTGVANYAQNTLPKCGGKNHISVYNAAKRINSFKIKEVPTLKLYESTSIETELENGQDVEYLYRTGDGRHETTQLPSITHIYNEPGIFSVKVEASNTISGTFTDSINVTVTDEIHGAHLECDHGQILGEKIDCFGYVDRGSPSGLSVDFGDGSVEVLKLHNFYSHVGNQQEGAQLNIQSLGNEMTVILPSAVFQKNTTVYGWEIQASKSGKIKLQVFEPSCQTSETYCQSTHMCTTTISECDKNTFTEWNCAPDEVFCMLNQRCVKTVASTLSQCTVHDEFAFIQAPADYKKIYEKEYTISGPGVFFIKEDPPFHAKTNQILGWSKEQNGGELAYTSLQNGGASEFIYPTSTGMDFVRDTRPIKSSTKHLLSAHTIERSHFYFEHRYAKTGMYLITTNITDALAVYVDERLDKIEITCPGTIFTESDFTIQVADHAGSNVSYLVDLGNGKSHYFHQKALYPFQYDEPGVYTLSFTGSNSVSRLVQKCSVKVLDDIVGLTFTEDINPTELGHSTTIDWQVTKGTNVTYTIIFGDSQSETLYVTNDVNIQTSHTYTEVGEYVVSIQATNVLGSSVDIQSTAIIEIAIGEVIYYTNHPHITDNVFLKTNQDFETHVNITNGTNVRCSFIFNDTSSTQTPQTSFIKQFNNPGIYISSVICKNAISERPAMLPVTIYVDQLEPITDLAIVVTGGLAFGEDAIVKSTMSSGSVYTCLLDFGDGESLTTDPAIFGEAVIHRYLSVGRYEIKQTCSNELGTITATHLLEVNIPPEGLGIVCPVRKYVKVGELLEYYVGVRGGTNINLAISFGNGDQKVIQVASNSTTPLNYTYNAPGVYTVGVEVSNQLKKLESSCDVIIVEQVIKDCLLTTNSPIRLYPGVSIFQLSVKTSTPLPSNAEITWNFGDGTSLVKDKFPNNIPFIKEHQYTEPGQFQAIIEIANNVSRVSFSRIIDIQQIVNPEIQFFSDKSGEHIPGTLENIFALEDNIYINVTKQPRDVEYQFNTGDLPIAEISRDNYIVHQFTKPGNYNVSVLVINQLGDFKTNRLIIVQSPIKNIQVIFNEKALTNEDFVVKINATNFGSSTYGYISMGDGNVYLINEHHFDSDPIHYLNHRDNVTKINFDSDMTTQFNITHGFKARGDVNITIDLMNSISSFHTEKTITVIYQPCPNPLVNIAQIGTQENPMLIKLSEATLLSSNVDYHCPSAINITFLWEVSQNDKLILRRYQESPLPLKLQLAEIANPSLFNLPPNLLEFGLARVDLTVFFSNWDVDLSTVSTKNTTWLEVEPSNLKSTIQGGVRRAVGFERVVIFDASSTFDPNVLSDNELETKADIQFSWFCRRAEETFTNDYLTRNPNARDSGCYGNSKFKMEEAFGGFRKLNNEGSMISINTTLRQEAKYVMRVYATKGKRFGWYDQEFQVLPGDPPILRVSCLLNCFEKLNPEEPLKMKSECSNCNGVTKTFYRWRLYKRDNTTDNDLGSEDTSLELKTSTSISNPNIALKRNKLLVGTNYVLKLSAWKDGGSESKNAGYGEFYFTVNDRPSGGDCLLSPSTGVALEDVFKVTCANWFDTDSPLLYKIDSLRNGIIQNLYYGTEGSSTMDLPLGDPFLNYQYQIIVTIMDKYHFGTKMTFNVTVKEPTTVNYDSINNNLETMSSDVDGLQKLARYALAAGSVMNSKESSGGNGATGEADDQAMKERSKMLKSISKVTPCSLSGIKQMGGVQMEMTKTGINEEAEEESGEALSKMSACMSNAPSSDPDMEDTANAMFLASSNVLKAGLSRNTNMTNSTGKSFIDKTIDTFNKIGGAFMRQMVAGDEKKTLNTGDMQVEMSQVADSADKDADEDTGFKLPNLDHLYANQSMNGNSEGDGTEQKSSVGAMLTSMDKNPYSSASGSDDLNSTVMGLALTGPDGSPMDLSGQELTMFVKRNDGSDEPAPIFDYNVHERLPMTYHRVNFTSENKTMVIELRPEDPLFEAMVFIAFERKPTGKSNSTVYSYKQQSKERSTLPNGKVPNSTFHHFVTASELNGTGSYYVGIRLLPVEQEFRSLYGRDPVLKYSLRMWEAQCKLWNDELNMYSSKGCKVGPKTTFSKTQCQCIVGADENEDDENFSTTTTTTTTTTTQSPFAKSHSPAPQRTKRKITRATFASAFFPAPNPIDFSTVFQGFTNLDENPLVFSVVLSIFGVYLMLMFWARREDRKDVAKAGVTALVENDPFDRQFYEITVYTGFPANAGTTANVFIELSGDESQTEARQLRDNCRKLFQSRAENVFLTSYPKHIGDLQYVRIWHDNTGKSPAWNLSRVVIHDLNADRKYLFINDDVIAVEAGDGSLERTIPIAGPDEVKSFNHLFYSTTQRNITDKHIWFSIFIRPAKSRFTRVQRLSCCLTLLYFTMLSSMMFFEVGGAEASAQTTYHLGPFAFAPSQIGIGVMTTLIIFPINILIVGVFRSIGPKPAPADMAKRKARSFWIWHEFKELFTCCVSKPPETLIDIMAQPDSGRESRLSTMTSGSAESTTTLRECISLDTEIGFKLDTPKQEKEREAKLKKKQKQKRKLPWWMKYFAWMLNILASFTAAFFVVLYGFQFGKEKSSQWFSTFFLSFIQDVFIAQPMKVLGLALFIALILKKPSDEEDDDAKDTKEMGYENRIQNDEEFLSNTSSMRRKPSENKEPKKNDIIRFQPPSKEKVQALRDYRLKEIKMWNVLRELILYLMYVVVLCQVSYSHLDPKSFQLRQSSFDTFVKASYGGVNFEKTNKLSDVWQWLETTVVEGLFKESVYTGQQAIPGYTQDYYSNVFGGARIRQIRILPDSCTVHEMFDRLIPRCHDEYSWAEEDVSNYDPGWEKVENHTHFPVHYKSWEYQTSAELDTYPFVGRMAAYAGGGYTADLVFDQKFSLETLNILKKDNWIDERTRALFVEITTYNAQVNLFTVMNLLVEVLPTGGLQHFSSIRIARLYTFGGSTESFTLACQFFVILFMMVFIYKESKKIYRQKRAYFSGFWNLLEFVLIVLTLTSLAIFFRRMLMVDSAVKGIQDNPGKFVSFNKVVQWDTMFSVLSSIVVFMSCLKGLRLLQYNKTISILSSTLQGCARPLGAFSIIFLVFFMAFTIFAYIMFMPHLEKFSSFVTSMESVMGLLLGDFDFSKIESTKPILGRFWFCLLMLFGSMYMMNVFLAIIMDTYCVVTEDIALQNNEHEIVDFMVNKFLVVFGRGDGGQKALLASIAEKERMKQLADEEKEAEEENNRNSKKPRSKVSYRPQRKQAEHGKYFKMIDDEIEMKFAQLDDSLDGFWMDFSNQEQPLHRNTKQEYGCGLYGDSNHSNRSRYQQQQNGRGIPNMAFDYQEEKMELLIQRDLEEELQRWS